MTFLLDGLIVLLFVLCVVLGHRCGFVRTISGLLALVVALLVAAVLSSPISRWLYTATVEPTVTAVLENYVEEEALPTAKQLDTALDKMPGYVTALLEANGIADGEAVLKRVEKLDMGETAVRAITKRVIAPVVLRLIELLCSILLFVLTYILARILLRALDALTHLPLIRQTNRLLGLLAGALQGVLWATVATYVLYTVAALTTMPWLTTAVLEDTYLISWINGFL